MSKPAIHFCHANGFPAKSYNVMLNMLSQDFDLHYIDMHGHHENYPITDNWSLLVEELIHDLERKHTQPIIAIGHSMGGALIYMAARQRPELFKHIILLDPPLLDNLTSQVIRFAKKFNFIDKITPAGRTFGRQEQFDSHQHAIEYFSSKTLFKNADTRCIADYVKYGTEPANDGIKLRFSAENEVNIYRTLPHRIAKHGEYLGIGGTLVYGECSNVVRPALVKHLKGKVGMKTVKVKGGHLFPLEHPEATAYEIINIIEAL